jgi:hypothetical protein
VVKAYCDADLMRSLEIVIKVIATGTASSSFPRCFKTL